MPCAPAYGEAHSPMRKKLSAEPVSVRGCEAVFTSFAKGATNGVAYPRQVDEEMARWLTPDTGFNVNKLEESLIAGKLWVFIGWFLYIGLQFGGVYIVFFVPFMKQFFPDFDFYFVVWDHASHLNFKHKIVIMSTDKNLLSPFICV